MAPPQSQQPLDPDPVAIGVEFAGALLRITLSDGRELAVPLEWLPRRRDATNEQRVNRESTGRGHGLHWPRFDNDIDEDISVRALLGRPT